MLFPRPEGSSLVDGFTLLGSTLLHCGAVQSPLTFCSLTLSFCELKICFLCCKDLLPSVIKSDF